MIMQQTRVAASAPEPPVVPDPATRPWVAHYAADVPATIAIPAITLPEFFADAVGRFAARPALTFRGRTLTYGDLDRLTAQFANRLRQLGLQQGDRVLLILPNLPQFPIAHFGTLRAGGVVAPLSPLLTAREIAHLAADVGARIAVVYDGVYPQVADLHRRGALERVIIATPDEYLPLPLRLLYPLATAGARPGQAPDDPARGLYRFRRLLRGADDHAPAVAGSPDDVAVLAATGGTTGLPKAVALTHRNLVANALQIRHWIPALRPGVEVTLSAAPFFHAYGMTTCLHLPVLLGARQILVPRPTGAELAEAIRKYQPTVFPGVPMLYAELLAAVRDDPARVRALRSLRQCISGSTALAAPLQREFERVSGTSLVEGYGTTEASPVVAANPFDGRARGGSIGLPFPNTEIRLVDPRSGAVAPPGGPGELLVRGPQVMRGYWRRPAETAEALRDGWLHTGDVATMDADGYFRIVDRTKDIIITGGENIYPHEIEEVLRAHPQIDDVAVVGVPHELAGQVARAYIVPRAGATLTRREVLQYCRERLAKFKVPRQIEFRTDLPRSSLGKVLRRELVAEG